MWQWIVPTVYRPMISAVHPGFRRKLQVAYMFFARLLHPPLPSIPSFLFAHILSHISPFLPPSLSHFPPLHLSGPSPIQLGRFGAGPGEAHPRNGFWCIPSWKSRSLADTDTHLHNFRGRTSVLPPLNPLLDLPCLSCRQRSSVLF